MKTGPRNRETDPKAVLQSAWDTFMVFAIIVFQMQRFFFFSAYLALQLRLRAPIKAINS